MRNLILTSVVMFIALIVAGQSRKNISHQKSTDSASNKPTPGQTWVLMDTSTIKRLEIKKEREETFGGLSATAVGILFQSVSLIGLIITLAYLAKQNGIANKNNMLAAFQHSMDNINEFNNVIAESEDLARIIINGRISFSKLNDVEKLRFEHTYGRLLNIVEAWHTLATETAMSQKFKDQQIQNIKAVVTAYFNYAGVLEFWQGYQSMYLPVIANLITDNTTVQPYRPAPETAAQPS